jgi:DNA repair exonuclease SbcCD ATPase subunit
MSNFLTITETRSRLSIMVAKRDAGVIALESTTSLLEQNKLLQEAISQAKQTLQVIGTDCQEQCQRQIGYVVTRCLKAVFGDKAMEFVLVFEQKRGQTEVRGVYKDAEGHELDPVNSCGGGVLDVASFGLRLACLMLSRPRPAKVLVLDEPFRFLSANYRDPMRSLLAELADEFGIQIVLITHIQEFMDFEHKVQIDG